jgi:hypothetical protein
MTNQTQSPTITISRDIRTSGLLAMPSQDLQTLICLMTYTNEYGNCIVSGRDIARSLNLSEKQGVERLRRLLELRFHGKPLVVNEGMGSNSGKFAKGRYSVAPLPGMEFGLCSRRYDGQASEEGCFPLPPGKIVKLSDEKPASVSSADDSNVVDNIKQQDEGKVQEGESGLLELLRKHGVTESTASELAQDYPADRIARQLEMISYRNARNPAAMLVKAIRDDWAPPPEYSSVMRAKAERLEKEKAEYAAKAESDARERLVADAMAKLSDDELRDITEKARNTVKDKLKGSLNGYIPQTLVDAQVKKIILSRSTERRRNGSRSAE